MGKKSSDEMGQVAAAPWAMSMDSQGSQPSFQESSGGPVTPEFNPQFAQVGNFEEPSSEEPDLDALNVNLDDEEESEADEFEGLAKVGDSPDMIDLQSRKEAADIKMVELKAMKADIDAQIAKVQKEQDELIKAIEDSQPVKPLTNAIQGYLARQREELNKRATRIKAISSNKDAIKELFANLKSPIDEAMSRKNNRGKKRPSAQ